MSSLIIFDVDGTLTPFRQGSTGRFEQRLLPNVKEVCARLRASGHILALASNQGGAAPSKPGRLTIGAVHSHLRWVAREVGASAYRFAISSDRKKPSPSMLVELMREFGVTPASTIFIGDADNNAQAAAAVGCTFVWAKDFFKVARRYAAHPRGRDHCRFNSYTRNSAGEGRASN